MDINIIDIVSEEAELIKLGLSADDVDDGLIRFTLTFGNDEQLERVLKYVHNNVQIREAGFGGGEKGDLPGEWINE